MADKFKLLSQAIRAGCAMVPEYREMWVRRETWEDTSRIIGACALCTAMVALRMEEQIEGLGCFNQVGDALNERFGVPMHILQQSSRHHAANKWSREQVADWLEKKGY